jgi:hypothetical protein
VRDSLSNGQWVEQRGCSAKCSQRRTLFSLCLPLDWHAQETHPSRGLLLADNNDDDETAADAAVSSHSPPQLLPGAADASERARVRLATMFCAGGRTGTTSYIKV